MSTEERMLLNIKSEKIVGGREVENIANWAFIGNLGGYCGGTIIGDVWFLTAAHCCASTPIGKKIYFGVLNPWEVESSKKLEINGSFSQIIHNIYKQCNSLELKTI